MMIDVNGRKIRVDEGTDEQAKRYFRFWLNESTVTSPFSVEQIIRDAKPLFTELSNAGVSLFTNSARNKFLKELQELPQSQANFKVATRVGWYGRAFVLPDLIIGETKTALVPYFRDLDPHMLDKYRSQGSLEDWQNQIGDLCEGNSRLMFAVSLGLTGPMLRFSDGPQTGGFQLVGDAEEGKTTVGMVGGSVLGCHRSAGRQGFMESWHTTPGKLELTALAHNETTLSLDETKRAGRSDQARAQTVIDSTFALAEGMEKQRLTNTISARDYRFYFLSTSNYTVSQLARRGGLDVDEAVLGRLTDIPSPLGAFGIYEDLHGLHGGAELTDELKVRCRKFFGSPFREFVRKLVMGRAEDLMKLIQFIADRRAWYLQKIKALANANGLRPLNRASGRFATVYAAGCLAIEYGILGWDRKAFCSAILSCQLDGLRLSKQDAAPKPALGILRKKLIEHFRKNGRRFMDLDTHRPILGTDITNVRGFTATFKGRKWFYLSADGLRDLIGSGGEAKKLIKELTNKKVMIQHAQRPIFRGGKGNKNCRRVQAFRADIIN